MSVIPQKGSTQFSRIVQFVAICRRRVFGA
jgi:hypothetical protein